MTQSQTPKLDKIVEFQYQKILGGLTIITKLNIYKDFLHRMALKTYVDLEFYYQIPVTIVSAYESFFKHLIATYIDRNKKYLDNAVNLISKDKLEIEYEVLKGIQDKQVSIGSLFALSLKYSTESTIVKNLNRLLFENGQGSFYSRIKEVSPFDLYDKTKKVVEIECFINDIPGHIKAFKQVFDLRHQYIHRYGSSLFIEPEEALDLLNKNINFLHVVNRMEWEDLFSDQPLTTADMINHASNDLAKADSDLKTILLYYKKHLPLTLIDSFNELESKWNDTIDKSADFFTNNIELHGSINRLTYISNLTELKKGFAKFLNDNNFILPFPEENDKNSES